jgi:tRNA pseudouridine38-40 synthase
MHEAAQCLVGKQDFTSFRAVSCQSHSPVRTLSEISVTKKGDYIVLEVAANAFLHHMVRNIVGSLVKVGTGERSVEWMADTLAAKDRTKAGATARPNGLYLVDVTYPDEFVIPKSNLGPIFL